jgi:flagellar hook-associated protein 3 FlgL
MKVSNSSELARMHSFQRRTASIEEKLATAGKELSTGLKSDLHQATGGNLGKLHAIERSLARNTAYTRNLTLVEQRMDGAQNALGLIQSPLDKLSINLVSASGISDHVSSITLAGEARLTFANAVGALNTTVNGQTLFAGAALDNPALTSGQAILAELDALVAADVTAGAAIAKIEAYFAKAPTAGGFYTSGYLGSTADMGSVDVGEDNRVNFAFRADDEEIVNVLKGLALAAVVAGGALSNSQDEQMDMLSEAGAQLLQAKEGLLDYRSAIGVVQQNVESAKAWNVSETEALELARVDLISADATEAATVFQALEAQLETVYTVTTRLSNLSFVNFMGR